MKKIFTFIAMASIAVGASAQHLMLVDGRVQEMPQQKQESNRQILLEKEKNAREQQMQIHEQQMRAPQHIKALAKGTYVERFDKCESESGRLIQEYAENDDYVRTHSVKKDGVWCNTTKQDCAFDEEGNLKSYTRYSWSDDSWMPLNRTDYPQYDANGNCTQSLYYDYKDGDWVLSSKSEREYYDDGQLRKTYSESYSNGSLEYIGKYEYYENGQLSLSFGESYKNGELDYSSKYEYYENGTLKYSSYAYASSGNEKSETWYDENGNKTIWGERWTDYESSNVCRMQHHTTYNEKNLKETDLLYMWAATDWQLVGKTEYKYDKQDRTIEKFYYEKDGDSWNLTSGPKYIWEDGTTSTTGVIETYKYDYTKFENENHEIEERCSVYYYYWNDWQYDSSSSFVNKYNANNQIILEEYTWYKLTYEYDAKGNLLSEYRYSGNASQWKADTKKLYTYDADGNKIAYEQWNWDSEKYEWRLSTREEYVHELMTLECEMYDERNGYKYEYTFDENDILRSEIGYRCVDGEWIPRSKYEYTDYYYSLENPSRWYDSNYWQYTDGEWKLGLYNDKKFDDRGNVLESTTYTSWEGYWHKTYTYDYSVDPAQIWGWDGGAKVLSSVETNLETNEVIHVKYYYTSLGNTSVQSVEHEAADGQVIYDIAGRRMQQLQKGINIVDKKKVVVK